MAIAVLLVLMLISTQVVRSIGVRSQDTRCATNLRILGSAMQLCSQDYNNTIQSFMGGSDSKRMWGKMLLAGGYLGNVPFADMDAAKSLDPALREVGNVFRCPVGEISAPKYDNFSDPKAWIWQTYGMAMYDMEARIDLFEGATRVFIKPLASVVNPSRYLLFADSSGGEPNHYQSFRISHRFGSNAGVGLRHDGKAYAVFLDGHVALIDRKQAIDYGVPQEIIHETQNL